MVDMIWRDREDEEPEILDAGATPLVQGAPESAQNLSSPSLTVSEIRQREQAPDPPHVREDYREVWLSGWRAGADQLASVSAALSNLQKEHELLRASVGSTASGPTGSPRSPQP